MRELAKSMLSFSWAMSVFGADQAAKVFLPGDPSGTARGAASSFESLTKAAVSEMSQNFKPVYKSGDQAQKGMVDAMFGNLPQDAIDPSRMMKAMTETMNRMMGGQAGRSG